MAELPVQCFAELRCRRWVSHSQDGRVELVSGAESGRGRARWRLSVCVLDAWLEWRALTSRATSCLLRDPKGV